MVNLTGVSQYVKLKTDYLQAYGYLLYHSRMVPSSVFSSQPNNLISRIALHQMDSHWFIRFFLVNK